MEAQPLATTKGPPHMSDSPYLFAPAPPASLGIVGDTRRFVVGRVFCVGRNYAEHAREMGSDPVREPPFFFSKHASSVVAGGYAGRA